MNRKYALISILVSARAALFSLSAWGQGGAPTTCLSSGTEEDINAVLVGPGDAAVLCPGAVFTLNNAVVLSAPNQQLYTEGLPTDSTRALLRINAEDLTNAIDGNNQPGIVIQNIQVDGNRNGFGPLSGVA